MDIKQLDYFIKVCESGSFTAAAKKYFISPQGINMAVIRLEKELGKKLFIREKNSVVMTKDGEYLYKKAQERSDDRGAGPGQGQGRMQICGAHR